MKRLAMLVAAGLMGLMLSACGEHEPKKPEIKSDVVVEQPAAEHSDAGTDTTPAHEEATSDAQTQE
jgi:hypothetical protein